MATQTDTFIRDGRMGRPPLDLHGQHFGTLEALRRKGASGWLCRCSACGAEATYPTEKLRTSRKALCPCQPNHGMGRPTFASQGRMHRSVNPNVQSRLECEWLWGQAAQAFSDAVQAEEQQRQEERRARQLAALAKGREMAKRKREAEAAAGRKASIEWQQMSWQARKAAIWERARQAA